MSTTETSVPVDRGTAPKVGEAAGQSPGGGHRRRLVTSYVAGGIVCVLAAVFLVGGGWALWKDRVDRDGDNFVTIGSNDLETETYAIVGDLRGDGPSWLWGSTVLGDVRVRATSASARPLFIGIAPEDAVDRYLDGAGYATVEGFDVSADTTHAGDAPPGRPSAAMDWAASTQGTGEQTLEWETRSGDWSVVLMNADAGADVAVHGDASAELPILPWLAGGLLLAGAALAVAGGWVLIRTVRREGGHDHG